MHIHILSKREKERERESDKRLFTKALDDYWKNPQSILKPLHDASNCFIYQGTENGQQYLNKVLFKD